MIRVISLASAFVLGLGSVVLADEAKPDPPVLKQTTTQFPKGDNLEARILTATIAPGATSVWHTHTAPVAVYVIEGVFTLEIEGKPAISKKQGEGLLETAGEKVRAANHGDKPAKVVIFQISDPAKPFMDPSK